MPEQQTEELSTEQIRRELIERERARQAEQPGEQRAATRRADRAAYLKRKLAERARSEDEAGR